MSRVGFFVGGVPVPMLSGGAAASAEFLLTPWLSLNRVGSEKCTTTTTELVSLGPIPMALVLFKLT